MQRSLTLFPHAKINLGLIIKGKLANGYHLLETLLYPIPELTDKLILRQNDRSDCRLQMAGIELDGAAEDNLCVRAYKALQKEVGYLPGVDIRLEKHIPAGAGLGGGSSDAAFTLKGLNELFDLKLDKEKLTTIAAGLGADVPFFIYDTPMLATGIGTKLQAFPLDLDYQVKLFPQDIHSSTIAAYKRLDHTQFDPQRSLLPALKGSPQSWKDSLHNDLEVPVFGLYPQLAKVKEKLYQEGAIYAAMSGSGSAMFGIFKH